MMNRTRASYKIGQYVLAMTDEALGIELLHDKDRPVAMGFSGKRQRPDFHFTFKSHERALEYVAQWLAGVEKKKVAKVERREQAKAIANTLKVGDVLRSTWGYDQTNVDFYEVVQLVGKCSVRIREISQLAEHGDMRGTVVPKPGAFIGEPMLKRVGANGWIRLTSFSGASLFAPIAEIDGVKIFEPSSYTAYA